MNHLTDDLEKWSKRTWIGVTLLIAVVQLSFVIFCTQKSISLNLRKNTPPGFAVEMVSPAPGVDSILQFFDQRLFAEAHPRGFSGMAWLEKGPKPYEINVKVAPPELLGFSEAQDFSPTFETPSFSFARKTRTPILNADKPAVPVRSTSASTLEMEGLPGRPVTIPVKLPLQFASDVLTPTVVQIGVDPEGFVRSTRMLESSGSKTADSEAMNTARNLQFARLAEEKQNPGNLQWGKLIFHWFALELTNNASAPR